MRFNSQDVEHTLVTGMMPGGRDRWFSLALGRKQISQDDTREIVHLELRTEEGDSDFFLLKDDMKKIAAELLRLAEIPP